LGVPAGGLGLLAGALIAGTGLQLAARWAAATPHRATIAAATTMAAIPAVALTGHAQALSGLLSSEWPLLALAACGVLRACWAGRGGPALMLLAAVALLGSIYTYRNAGSERYLAQLLPLACVAAGLVAASFGQRLARGRLLRLLVPAATLALVPVLAAPRPQLGTDTFAALAGRLSGAPAGPLFSATPDAYGFLLPDRPQRTLRPGSRGLILLDGAQRAYAPGLQVRGVVVARLAAPAGFERPDGVIDIGPAVLMRGVAVAGQPRSG
jgi:hypothetical protein